MSDHDRLADPSPRPVLRASAQRCLADLNSDPALPRHPRFTLTQRAAPSPLAGAITLVLVLVRKHERKRALRLRSRLHASAVLCRYPGG